MRVGLGTSTTLSATINPDFGQVELDPAVLNLSVFETFFPEKRPFFLEDSRSLAPAFGRFPMFHSRRIGQAPGRLELADNEELVSKPGQTTILGAAKVTGKASGWTFGGLTALTAREYGIVETTSTNADGEETVSTARKLIEPRTAFGVGRVQRDILSGTSNVGAIATAVVREKDLDAFTAGGDFNIRWNKNLYILNGQWVATHAPIDGEQKTAIGGATDLSYVGKQLGLRRALRSFRQELPQHRSRIPQRAAEQGLAVRRAARDAGRSRGSSRAGATCISTPTSSGTTTGCRSSRTSTGFSSCSFATTGTSATAAIATSSSTTISIRAAGRQS